MKWIAIVIMLIIFSAAFSERDVVLKQQSRDIETLKAEVEDMRTALQLTSREHWYFIRPGEVSSEMNGKGAVAMFTWTDWTEQNPDGSSSTARFNNSKIKFMLKGQETGTNLLRLNDLVVYKFLE